MTPISWLRATAEPGTRVGSLSLACCALEVESAIRLGLLRRETEDDADPERTAVLVAGTVTGPLAPVVREALLALPPDTTVVAFGACATSGGPYWDAPTVEPGAGEIVSVTAFVPGCPPSPAALMAAVLDDQGRP